MAFDMLCVMIFYCVRVLMIVHFGVRRLPVVHDEKANSVNTRVLSHECIAF